MTTLIFTAESRAADINQAIRDADDGPLTVVLSAGTYDLDEPIRIQRSDVTVTGGGVGETILRTASLSGHNAQAIVVHGGDDTGIATTLRSSTVADGSTQIVLNSAAGITAGMVLRIEQANDDAYFAETGNTHLDAAEENAAGHELRQMLAEVVAVDGDTVTLRTATPYAFTGSDANAETVARVTVPDLLTGIEISGLTVTSDLEGTPDGKDFTNPYEEYAEPGDNAAVEVFGVRGMKLHDVATVNTASTAFNFGTVYGSEFDSLEASGAFNKGGQGNGYAFQLRTAFNNTMTNLVDQDMRHSVLFASFSAEHYNTIHVASTNRDINFHGSDDSHNTVVVDSAVLDFEEGDSNNAVQVGNALIHPRSVVEANDVTFKYLRGSWSKDTAHGNDEGSTLRGMQGADSLYGGAGVDLIDGGTEDDVLSGGAGADTFVYRRGYGADTVLDFETGTAGDTLDLARTGITGRFGLSARHMDGNTVLSIGGGDSLTLLGVDKAGYAAMNIAFAAKTTRGVEIQAWGSDLGFTGTAGDDTFILKPGNFDDDAAPDLFGVKGLDTLRIAAGSGFDAAEAGRIRGIEVLDMSGTPRRAQAAIDQDFVDQADKGQVTIKYGKFGLYLDTGDVESRNDVKLDGRGQVLLGPDGGVVSAAGKRAIDVRGNSGDDEIRGGSGDDRIDGGPGKDTLRGGGGDDAFVFLKKSGSRSADIIEDFSNKKGNNDHFEIDAGVWKGVDEGWLDPDQFVVVSGDKPKLWEGVDQDHRVLYDRENGDIWFDRDGSDTRYAMVKLAEVTDDLKLTAKDFLII